MKNKLTYLLVALAIPSVLAAGETMILGGTATNGANPPEAMAASGDFSSGEINTSANAVVTVETNGGGNVLIGGSTKASVDTATGAVSVDSGYVSAYAPAGTTVTIKVGDLTLTLTNGASVVINSQGNGQIAVAVLSGSIGVSGPSGDATVASPGNLASSNKGMSYTSWSPTNYKSVSTLSPSDRIPLQLGVGEASRLIIAQDSLLDTPSPLSVALSGYITSVYETTLADFNSKRNEVDFYLKVPPAVFHETDSLKNELNDPTLVISDN